jgi:HEPN domain-containing protein
VEKALKALWVMSKKEHPPRSHNLVVLAEEIPVDFEEAVLDLLAELNEFNLEARYPDIGRSLYQKEDRPYTHLYVEKTQGVLEWLLQRF